MARTEIPLIDHAPVANALKATGMFSASPADVANGNSFKLPEDGRILLIARNTDATSRTITFSINPALLDREDGAGSTHPGKVATLTAGQNVAIGPFPASIYRQDDGLLYLDASSTLVHLYPYRVPEVE